MADIVKRCLEGTVPQGLPQTADPLTLITPTALPPETPDVLATVRRRSRFKHSAAGLSRSWSIARDPGRPSHYPGMSTQEVRVAVGVGVRTGRDSPVKDRYPADRIQIASAHRVTGAGALHHPHQFGVLRRAEPLVPGRVTDGGVDGRMAAQHPRPHIGHAVVGHRVDPVYVRAAAQRLGHLVAA